MPGYCGISGCAAEGHGGPAANGPVVLQAFSGNALACVLFAMEGVATVSVPAHDAEMLSSAAELEAALGKAAVPTQTAQAVCKAAKDKAPSQHHPGAPQISTASGWRASSHATAAGLE